LRLMFVRLGMKALVTCFEGPCHIVGLAEKAKQGVESFPSQSTSN